MRYLVHSEDATFTDGKYYFNLERRIANPHRIRVTQVCYTATTASTYPPVVYMRSSKLAELTKTKHTVELKDEGHYDSTDVISTLTETHTLGRYSAKRPTLLSVFEHVPIQKLDFYFTANRTAMPYSVASAGSSSSSVAADSDIEAISDLLMWIDYANARCLDLNYAAISGNVGDNIKYIYPRVPSDGNLIFVVQNSTTNNYEFELAQVGQGRGMRQETPNASGWYMMDSVTTANPTLAATWHLHHTFIMPPTLSPSTGALFDVGEFILGYEPSGQWFYYNSSNTKTILNTTWIPLRPYMLTATKELTGAQGAAELHLRFEDLVTGTVVTEVVDEGPPSNGAVFTWILGHAGYWFTHVAGPYIMANGLDATEIANCQSWIKSFYETEQSSEEEEVVVVAEDASFFVELEIDGTE